MLEKDFFWAQYCQGIAIGDTKKQNTYGWGPIDDYDAKSHNNKTIYSIFDTGSSSLMISSIYYDSLIEKIFEKVPDTSYSYGKNSVITTECDASYPSLFFMFDGSWIEVSPEHYLFQKEDGEECTVLIMPVESPTIMLGMPLFIDYYTVFNPESATISFAPHKDSEKESLVSGPVPPKSQYLEALTELPISPGQLNWMWFAISWVLTLTLLYGGSRLWATEIKPSLSTLLSNGSAYYFVYIFMVFSAIVCCAFVVQPYFYAIFM